MEAADKRVRSLGILVNIDEFTTAAWWELIQQATTIYGDTAAGYISWKPDLFKRKF